MHYKNGRVVKVGDQIVALNYNGTLQIELVIAVTPGATTCNLSTVPIPHQTGSRTASECLHVEDAINLNPPPPAPADPSTPWQAAGL